VHRADRSTATVRNAYRIGCRMAGNGANVNDLLLGQNNGEGQTRTVFSDRHDLITRQVVGAPRKQHSIWLWSLDQFVVELTMQRTCQVGRA
jgi:hypothetical protein